MSVLCFIIYSLKNEATITVNFSKESIIAFAVVVNSPCHQGALGAARVQWFVQVH